MYRRAVPACLLWVLLLWMAALPAGANPPRCKCQEGAPQEVSLLVDIDRCRLVVFAAQEPYRQYQVAVGRPESPTPPGKLSGGAQGQGLGSGFRLTLP